MEESSTDMKQKSRHLLVQIHVIGIYSYPENNVVAILEHYANMGSFSHAWEGILESSSYESYALKWPL